MYWLKLPLALAMISLAHFVAAQEAGPCTAFLSDVVPKDDGSLEFIILSAPNDDGSYCEGELIGSGSTEATFIMTPNGGGDGDAFSYILPADKAPTRPVEWRVRTSAGDTNYIFYPPFDPNPPPYQCEIEITGVNTVPGDGLGGYINIEGTAPAGCNPLKVNIYGADEDNAVSEEGTALSSASEAWSYQSNADFAPGGYTIVVSALSPDDSNYLPGALEEPYSYTIAEQERGCLSAPEIIDSSCQQGDPSSLSMTIAVTTGNKECVITVTKDNDDLYTFVFAPESDGSQTISIPSQYMGSTIAGYNVYNDQGEAPRDVICPYSRLPVRCKIEVTGVRSVKGPGGGFFASVDASAQSGCGPYNYYIHNDDDADFGETDDLPFQSDKELSPGSYTITLSNNPQDPDEYLYADVVDFSFTLGGPESSLRRRRTGCASGEDLCFDPDGIARCYADLDSNLARCGGCNGPDCTRLPHVEGAHCHLGQCIVDLCSRGFHLQDNACAPGFADEGAVGRLFIQA